MKIGIFGGVDYQDPSMPSTWPRRPKYYDAKRMQKAHHDSMMLYEMADDVGIDFLTVSEHHYGGPGIEPNCHIAAAALGPIAKNAKIALLGPNLVMNNPVRLAEEIAQLDMITDGKIGSVALLRGTPNEVMTYFNNPAESRDMWEEGVELMLRAWKEEEPFGWDGRHYRYRLISLWPKFIKGAPPQILLSGNSDESVEFCLEMGGDLAISYSGPQRVKKQVDRFKEGAAARGRKVDRSNTLYRNFVYVSDSLEKATEECRQHGFGSFSLFTPKSQASAAVIGEAAQLGYASKGAPTDLMLDKIVDFGVPRFIGTPDQVIELLREYYDGGIGSVDLSFGGFGLPIELARKNLDMFSKYVLPEVHKWPDNNELANKVA